MSTLNSASNGVAVLYAATTPASGLDAEQTHVYLQSLELDSCTLGPRVDVVGDVHHDIGPPTPRFVGASDSVLAVAPYKPTAASLLTGPLFMGINPANGETVWERSFPKLGVSIHEEFLRDVRTLPSFIEVGTSDFGAIPLEKTTLVSIATGKDVVAARRFSQPALELGENRFLYTDGNEGSAIFDNGKQIPINGHELSPKTIQMLREDGTAVAIGTYCTEGDDACRLDGPGSALGYLGTDNTITQILSAEKMSSLQLRLYGASNGKLYVETTSENLVIDLNGKQVGDKYELEDFPYYPLAERRIEDTTWTLWAPLRGSSFAITKDGVNPPHKDSE